MKIKMKHNWKPETMDECRKVFMDSLIFYYWNFSDGDFKKTRIYELIDQYSKIKNSVSKNEN